MIGHSMSELIANMERLSVVELAELVVAATTAIDRKLDQQLALIRPPAAPPAQRGVPTDSPRGDIFDDMGGNNVLTSHTAPSVARMGN